jgi:hypothetical protein
MSQRLLAGPPAAVAVALDHRPQLLSWDAADHPNQARLVPYREEIGARFGHLAASLPVVAVDLSCGLGPTSDLDAAGDLDNLLVPVVDALGRRGVVAAWASKDTGTRSRLGVGAPTPLPIADLAGWDHVSARTRSSASSTTWKQEIADQVAHARPLPLLGPAELVVAYRVGPGRAWINLWKPSIDSLGRIIGQGPRPWHPRDGRIVRLGLCLEIDPALGWDVVLDFWWRPAPPRG